MKYDESPPSAAIDKIAAALLYEGYLLYPYRLTALKNRYRWVFGVLFPRRYSLAAGATEPWVMQTECLLRGSPDTTVNVRVRFLHLAATGATEQETTQRESTVAEAIDQLRGEPSAIPFCFPAEGKYRRVEGLVQLTLRPIEENVFRLTVRLENHTLMELREQPDRDEALKQALISTHTILEVPHGEFISSCDPPTALRDAVSACCNIGTWPVLVGAEGRRDAMLSAPIILSDYPKVAPESPGDFFDGTEMDEMLTLRVLTLTDAEKRQVRTAGDRAQVLLERTEAMTEEQMLRLHGVISSEVAPALRVGARVHLRPRGRSDAMDVLLKGKRATIVAVEWDYEGQAHVAVTVDEDPGQDLGRLGQPGHRFFFRPDEVEFIDQ